MAIKIGHAAFDENKKIKYGKAGDQITKEVTIRNWYDKGWTFVLRCEDADKAEKMAKTCEDACKNDCIGYDQSQRNTLYAQSKNYNFDLSKIKTACECDCSSLMTVCAIAAGINVKYGTDAPRTKNMKERFGSTGEFEILTESKYLTSGDYLRRGDILVRPHSHTAMALEDGDKAYDATIKDVKDYLTKYYGNSIKNILHTKLENNNVYGKNTKKAITIGFQTELNKLGADIKVNGIFDKKTLQAFDTKVGTLKQGSSGKLVVLWQCLLVCHDKYFKIDGTFDKSTILATNKLSADHNRTQDGSVSGIDLKDLLE